MGLYSFTNFFFQLFSFDKELNSQPQRNLVFPYTPQYFQCNQEPKKNLLFLQFSSQVDESRAEMPCLLHCSCFIHSTVAFPYPAKCNKAPFSLLKFSTRSNSPGA